MKPNTLTAGTAFASLTPGRSHTFAGPLTMNVGPLTTGSTFNTGQMPASTPMFHPALQEEEPPSAEAV